MNFAVFHDLVNVNLKLLNESFTFLEILETHSSATVVDDIRGAGVETCTIIDAIA